MALNNYPPGGAFQLDDRAAAGDHIGVATQLVFPTSPNVWLEQLEHGDDIDLLYQVAEATNRAQTGFCANDPRLFPVGYVPLADLDQTLHATENALSLGAKALLIPWACPKNHPTSHIALDALWSRAEEAGVPILFHVGAADPLQPAPH